ncbi:MAG: mechanosensitive ion channel family protein [Melioribacteraceae bacterium]|nr:mechanosensitive ion channel family protein [Melioribacteraceae bacterium]
MIEPLAQSFIEFFDKIILNTPKILAAIVILLFTIFLGRIFRKIFINKIQRRIKDGLLSGFVAQIGKWIIYLFGILAALHIIGFGTFAASLLTGAGISAIIIGFAFKDIAENFLAGILLAINRPFNVGDIVEVDKYKGTVKNLELRTTHLRTVDGRDIYVPNSTLVKSSLVNFTKDGLLRLDFVVGLATDANIEEVRSIILTHLKNHTRILNKPQPNVIVENIGVSTLDVRVLFWIDILKSKTEAPDTLGHPIRSQILREVVELLLKNGYSLPSNVVEHKMYNPIEPITIASISDNKSV